MMRIEISKRLSSGRSALEASIAFFTALQIVWREKGISRKSDIPRLSAPNATASGTSSEITARAVNLSPGINDNILATASGTTATYAGLLSGTGALVVGEGVPTGHGGHLPTPNEEALM